MPESPASRIPEIGLPAGVACVEFVSDLHLCPEMPRTCAAFLSWLTLSQADALCILGDLFEVWVGDDSASLEFQARCLAALQAAAGRRPVAVMRGNRDFLLGPAFYQATGCTELPDPCVLRWSGQRLLLSHGDALCLDDVAYQRFRLQVRTPEWQSTFLQRPLTERLALAAQMRAASQAQHDSRRGETYAEPDAALTMAWLEQADCTALLHGHTHRPDRHPLPDGRSRWVLSDWDLDHGTDRAEVLRWDAAGPQRLPWPVVA